MGINGRHIIFAVVAFTAVLAACSSPKKPEEALRVVSEADSLWSSGKMYEDSVLLAQAYEELGSQNDRYPTEYVHACYHYGRLLREKEDPVRAMQAFIDASHTSSTDYHFLGRVYSNMGDMCHMAEEFSLSYDLFAKSADMFLQSGDTTAYYYALNDMAFELAEQGKKAETLSLLNNIEEHCDEGDVLNKTLVSKAELYLKCMQYDSMIFFAHQVITREKSSLLAHMQLAQAYSFLAIRDSAAHYAEYVIQNTEDKSAINNALYILTNDDDTQTLHSVREIASKRSDVQKLIENQRAKLAQATQLVELDMQKEPEKKHLYSMIVLIIFLATIITLVARNRRRRRQMQKQIISINEKHAKDILASIKKHIDVNDLNNTLHWKNYASMKSDADLYMGGIVSKLEARGLNETEIRFCILTVLDFTLKQIADIIHYGFPSGIKTLKKRTSDKLKTSPTKLKSYLLYKL